MFFTIPPASFATSLSHSTHFLEPFPDPDLENIYFYLQKLPEDVVLKLFFHSDNCVLLHIISIPVLTSLMSIVIKVFEPRTFSYLLDRSDTSGVLTSVHCAQWYHI